MSGLVLFFKSKVVLAILGAVLFGTAGTLVAAVPFGNTSSNSSSSAPQGQAGLAALDNGTATPGGTAQGSPTPTKTPTRAATPKPTNTPGTGSVTLRGAVQSVNTSANTFTIKLNNGTITTVAVTANTVFQGRANSLSGLQVGWSVSVKGTYQTDGTFAASNVNAIIDN